MERTLDENQPREQAGFRKGYFYIRPSATSKPNNRKVTWYNLPSCIGFIDYEKAFGTEEHFVIFGALRKTNINKAYLNILQNIYSQAAARIHLDILVSGEFL